MTRAVPVELVESEHVVPYGEARVTWLVQKSDGWVRATEWPSAVLEDREGGAGIVWQRAVLLELLPGTLLERVESRPRTVPRKDPLSYFDRQTARPRATRRTRYRVDVGGRLLPLSDRR